MRQTMLASIFHTMRLSSGFTLVELVTVIAVMAIMAATAAPRVIGSDSFDTRGNQGLLITSIRYAQKTAIAQHRMVYVNVDSVNRRLRLCYDPTCTSLLQDPVTVGNYQINFNSNVNLTASQTTMGFTIEGTPSPNVNINYTITNSKNLSQSSTIRVEANTGYVHLV